MKEKKKKKAHKKIKIIPILLTILIISAIGVAVYFFLNSQDEESHLTLLEKQWIEKNKNTLIDIKVPNNLSVLASEGDGVLFSFLTTIETNTGLKFNKVSYNYPDNDIKDKELGIVVLKNSDKLLDTDIVMTNDSYVLLGLKEGYVDVNDIVNTNVGILSSDKDAITKSLGSNINYKTYPNSTELYKALTDKNIDYIITARYASLKLTNANKLYTKYNFNNISNKIVLRFSDNDRLNNIMRKYLEDWKKDEMRKVYEKNLMTFFTQNNEITDQERHSLTSKVYKYGFVKNRVYNVLKANEIYGVAAEYIKTLSNMTDMEFSYNAYNSNEDLIEAIKKKEVDVAFVDFNYDNSDIKKSSSPIEEKMVALSKNYQNISDRNGLHNQKIYLYKGNYLYDYVKDNYNSLLKELDNNFNIDDDAIVLLDEIAYLYYRENEVSDLKVLFTDNYEGNNHFQVVSDNDIVYRLINFILNSTDYNEYKNTGVNNLISTLKKHESFKNIYFVLISIILIPLAIIIVVILANSNIRKLKIIKKEDVLRYNDMLTSLKNRNYLNANINKWDETLVFPRTIIIIDLNNLKYVNDNYGHEAGNELIKKAAAILINTQLENSEIIRTDGNEFLIYLVGYNKTQINTYISKLSREFEKLPHGFGAAVGFSMIEDEIKTVDDAINEATIEMRMDKEKNYR